MEEMSQNLGFYEESEGNHSSQDNHIPLRKRKRSSTDKKAEKILKLSNDEVIVDQDMEVEDKTAESDTEFIDDSDTVDDDQNEKKQKYFTLSNLPTSDY